MNINTEIIIEINPEVPPEIRAVLALNPIKTTETIPQKIRNTPYAANKFTTT
ncbi:hypothetical protein MYP_2746 [Sporocytophaga myxococcoides]|uniref:Uncharacterized protein n=1 Tax=Sporocytophaga myxococcoides TaxID=153721 RepID=A0A098LGF2_9BACT|nr:hypothetical protein MYP_2746 [Sporocytophaga myxococcoides]